MAPRDPAVDGKAELRASFDELEATLNALPDLFLELDREGRIHDFRAPRPELFRLPVGSLLEKTIDELMPADVTRVIKEALCDAARDGTSTGQVYTLATATGVGYFEPSVAVKGDPGSPEVRFIVLVRDISAHKRAEQAILRREKLLRLASETGKRLLAAPRWAELVPAALAELGAAAEVARVAVFEHRRSSDGGLQAELRFEWAAPGMSPLAPGAPFPWPDEAVWTARLRQARALPLLADELADPERALLAGWGVRSLLLVPILVERELWGLLAFAASDGTRAWSEGDEIVLQHIAGMLGVAVQRERAEATIRESERKYRTIFETTGTAMIIFGEDGLITLANRELEQLTGHGPEAIARGLHWSELFDERTRERIRQAQGCASVTAPRSHEATLIDHQGRRRAAIVVVDQIPGTSQRVASFLDITERRQAELQMLRADKMAALGQIIAGVAHEINNPNNFIYFNLPILKRYLEAMRPLLEHHLVDDPDLQVLNMPLAVFLDDIFKLLDNMQHGSERITRIVSELKDYIRGHEVDERRPDTLEHVVEHAMALVGKQLQKMVGSFSIEVAEGLPRLLINAGKIEQVLINLCLNAAQAADKPDSFVRVRVQRDPEDRGQLQIVVEDNGAGISEEILPRIFDPFFTTKRESGTGLGLAISSRIVEEHGGRIAVDSTPGSGSRFTVSLPIPLEAASPP